MTLELGPGADRKDFGQPDASNVTVHQSDMPVVRQLLLLTVVAVSSVLVDLHIKCSRYYTLNNISDHQTLIRCVSTFWITELSGNRLARGGKKPITRVCNVNALNLGTKSPESGIGI